MKTLKTIVAVIVVGFCAAACTESNIQPQQSTAAATVQQVGFEKASEQAVPLKPRITEQP